MVWFSERKELEKQYYEWIKENGIADQPNSVIAFLEINGLLKDGKVNEKAGIVKSKPTNFDKITESVESFVKWIYSQYGGSPPDMPCKETSCENPNCKECFKEWLQKECEDD